MPMVLDAPKSFIIANKLVESIPPDRNIPTGTSETKCALTDSCSAS